MALAESVGHELLFIAPGIAAVIASTLLSLSSARAKPLAGDETAGTITPGKRTAAFAVAVGGIMMVLGALCALEGVLAGYAAVLFLFGLAIAGFMAPSLTDAYNVSWTSQAIQGPSRLFGLALGTKRTTIAWRDIRKSGITSTRYWYVEASDGRRVYWSYLYPGYAALTVALRHHCPQLALPRDMR